MSNSSLKTITLQELAQHNLENDSWVAIKGKVLDVSKFAAVHPAGKKILL